MADQRLGWKDVRDRIHERILDGRYAPGDKLPRDADIAEELQCARPTVQRAMKDLSDSGIIERRRKGGTRVRSDPVARATLDIPITRLEVEARNARYGYRLIRQTVERAPASIQALIGADKPRDLVRIEALHLSDGHPYIFEDRWVNQQTVPDILAVDLTQISANEWLVLNKPYSRLEIRLYAETADSRMAETMGVAAGEALLVIERSSWIEDQLITTVKAMTAPGYRLVTKS